MRNCKYIIHYNVRSLVVRSHFVIVKFGWLFDLSLWPTFGILRRIGESWWRVDRIWQWFEVVVV